MSVTKVGDLIRLALQELEVLSAGDNPSAEEYIDGVDWYNVMLRSWDADESLQPNLVSANFNTISGTASYTIGTGGAFNTTRPLRITNAYVRWLTVDTPLGIKGKADYNLIQNKTQTGPVQVLYYVPSYPLGVIYFDRVPDQAYTIFCDMEVPVGDAADQNTTLAVSQEYHAALLYNLAIALAPGFKANLKPSTVALAKRSLERIQYQRHIAQAIDPMPIVDLVV